MRRIAASACILAVAVGPATAKGPGAHDGGPALVARTDGGVTTVRLLPSLGASRATAQRRIRGVFAVATVAADGARVGRSRDGSTIVLQEVVDSSPTRRFAILDGALRRPARFVALAPRFTVDALSRDGRHLYLTETGTGGDPLAYAVRVLDTRTGVLDPQPVVVKGGEQMAGEPIARADHPGGAWSYTLYAGPRHPFVHALNTQQRYSLCIDLPWEGATPAQIIGMRLRMDANGRLRVVTSSRPVRTLAVIDPASARVRVTGSPPAA